MRLLVADVASGGRGGPPVRPVLRRLSVTRLGRGMGAEGRLTDAAAGRTAAAVREYAALARASGAEPVVVGTYALREARNPGILLERLDVPVRVLDGAAEAALGFRGAVAGAGDLPPDARVLVLDVGGGSVELVWGRDGTVEGGRSLRLGCAVLTERFLHGDPPAAGEVRALRAYAQGALAPVLDGVRDRVVAPDVIAQGRPRVPPFDLATSGRTTFAIGVGGTVTSLAAMAQRLDAYDPERVHGFRLTREVVERSAAALVERSVAERRTMPGLHAERADVIAAGALVVALVLAGSGCPAIVASEADLLWALVAEAG